jgi:hypothetical protein
MISKKSNHDERYYADEMRILWERYHDNITKESKHTHKVEKEESKQ